VALSASLVLLGLARVYPIREFYVTGNAVMSNDQVGYLMTARWLAETGQLRSHLIYPAYVREPAWRLYMPGAYYALATAQVLSGPGPVAWRIPAMVSFVVVSVGVFLLGLRFYGRTEGVIAAAVFMSFPPMAAFAFTAMPTIPFVAAGVCALCLFAFAPPRLRPCAIPLLLVGPFLIRETGALLVVPMALVMVGDRRRRPWLAASASVLASVLLLAGLLAWQQASGRAALPLNPRADFNYSNAFPPSTPPHTFGRLRSSVEATVSSNVDALRSHLERRDGVAAFLAVIVVLSVLAALGGMRRPSRGGRDRLALGAALLVLVAASIITTLYSWYLYRGLRAMLFTFPLLAVGVAPDLLSVVRPRRRGVDGAGRLALLPSLAVLSLVLGGGWWSTRQLAKGFDTTAGKRTVAFMEGLGLATDGVLVAPADVALDYVLRHYPLRFSFLPRNGRTLRLLAERYPLRTLMVATNTRQGSSPRYLKTIGALGFVRTRDLPHPLQPGVRLLLFERPRPARGAASGAQGATRAAASTS
jgi:hypothetical protein